MPPVDSAMAGHLSDPWVAQLLASVPVSHSPVVLQRGRGAEVSQQKKAKYHGYFQKE